MNFARISKSLASVGVVGALAAAGVAAIAPAADAVDANGDYSCSALNNPLGSFPMSVSVPVLPATAPAGFPVPAGFLSMTALLTVPAGVVPLLQSLGVADGTFDYYTMTIGSKVVHAPLAVDSLTPNADGSMAIAASGANQAVSLPKAGTYEVKLPAAFTFSPTNATGGSLPAVTCTSAAPATLETLVLDKQASTIAVGQVKTVRTTQHAKVPVTVKNDYSTPTGKVVAKEGSKTLGTGTLKAGKAVISLARLKPGLHKVVVTYLGDAYTKGIKAAKPVTVKIIR